jgi:hypothetical protein
MEIEKPSTDLSKHTFPNAANLIQNSLEFYKHYDIHCIRFIKGCGQRKKQILISWFVLNEAVSTNLKNLIQLYMIFGNRFNNKTYQFLIIHGKL